MNLFTRSETSRRRVSYNQLEKLWEFVTSNREIALGFNRCSEARELARRMWETVASTLNSKHFDGAVKDAKSWCKYWNEYKSKLKKLAANLRTSNQESGGDPFAFRSLSDIENKFIQFLGEDFGYGVARVETFEESQTEIRTPPSSEPSMWDEPGPSWRTMPSNLPENLITYETPHFHTPLPPYHTPPSDDTAPESPHTTSTPVLSALLNPCTASPVHLQSPHPHTAPPRLHTEKPRPPRSKPPLYIAAAPPHTSHSTNQTQSSPPHTQSPRPHTQSPPHTQPPHPHTQPPRPLTSPASSQASSPRAPRRGRRRQRPLSAEEARTALVRISKRRAGVEEQNSLLLRQLVNDIRDIKQMLQRKNPQHKMEFSHPCDSDYGAGPRGVCPYGASCRRGDARHWAAHEHPPGTAPPPPRAHPHDQRQGVRVVERRGQVFYINAHTVHFHDDHYELEDEDGDSVDFDYEF